MKIINYFKALSHYQKTLLIFLISTAISRLIWTLSPSFRFDMNTWQAWTGRLVEVGPIHFYAPGYFADYFPGYLYMLWFLGKSFSLIFGSNQIFTLHFEIFLKLFTNLFDFGSALFIYKIVSKKNSELGLLSSIFYLINPALFFNSSVWGQVDGILAFFLIYSAYSILEIKKPFQWGIVSGISLMIKPQGLPSLLITTLYLLRNFKFKKYLSLLLIPLTPIILSIPFFLSDPILGLFHLLQKSANTYPYTSMFSYNVWSFVGFWIPDSNTFISLPYQAIGLIILSIIYLFIAAPLLFTRSKNHKIYYLAIALALFAFFLFPTRIHQRYLFPFFGFLLIYASLKKSIELIILYFGLSIVHLINLWYVYYYYNYVFGNSSNGNFFLYKFLSENYNWFTTINLLAFLFLMLIYYLSFHEKN